MWATHNPEMRFTTISSDYFRPSDEMLEWVAATGNIWVGHTVSAWFAADDLNSRFRSIARYLDAGIPTTVWIVTSAAWDNQAVLRRVLDLVSPQHIIEAPLSHGSEAQDNPLLGLNPLGPCGSQRYDRQGPLCVPVDGVYRVPLEAGGYAKPSGVPHARCSGCLLKCGYTALAPELEATTQAGYPVAEPEPDWGQRYNVQDLTDLAPVPEAMVEGA
jgi:hypothetical protein